MKIDRRHSRVGSVYGEKIAWLRDETFLDELERDSVDSEVFEEELDLLRSQQPLGCRQKMVKCLQSSPVQIVLCLVVLLDAGIVVAQILLDLHAVKEKVVRREHELRWVLEYVTGNWTTERRHALTDVADVLRFLRQSDAVVNATTGAAGWGGGGTGAGGARGVGAYLDDDGDVFHDAAHSLHFASIAVLGFLVLEDVVAIIAMGKEFFKHKTEIVDAIIVCLSFLIDLLLLRGVHGEEGAKAAVMLVILLLWRITRVADAIMVAIKQRQEFRIRLQKRVRRKAEKRVEFLEEERLAKQRQICSLKQLCTKAGVKDEDVNACTPETVSPRRISSTLCALTSVAKLSVSMTMSISSGLFSISDDDKATDCRLKIVSCSSAPPSPSSPLRGGGRDDAARNAAFSAADDDNIIFMDAASLMSQHGGSQPSLLSAGRGPSSPVNVSGVQIFIDHDGDATATSPTQPSSSASDCRLAAGGDTRRSLSVDSTSSADTDSSQQYLLANIR